MYFVRKRVKGFGFLSIRLSVFEILPARFSICTLAAHGKSKWKSKYYTDGTVRTIVNNHEWGTLWTHSSSHRILVVYGRRHRSFIISPAAVQTRTPLNCVPLNSNGIPFRGEFISSAVFKSATVRVANDVVYDL